MGRLLTLLVTLLQHNYLRTYGAWRWLLAGALLLASLLPRPAQAQPEKTHWKFGNQCGLTFPLGGGAPTLDPYGPGTADEACASISDASGVLQCYTDGHYVWDRNNNVMPGGLLSGSNYSASQGALLLRQPGQTANYYLFTTDSEGNLLAGGLRYSIVDMSRRAGLGDVTSVNSVPVSIPGNNLVTEKLTAVLHANGRDYWIVVHGWQNNAFYCYLLSASGLSAVPVVSAVGAVHAPVGASFANAAGYLRASPSGRTLAITQALVSLQLFDFDPATGLVSAPRTAPSFSAAYYGVEFSADNSKLYVTNGSQVFQLDLARNLALIELPTSQAHPTGLQRGPDGRIYIANYYTNYLSVIRQPNLPGTACDLVQQGVVVSAASGPGAMRVTNGLPHFPNAFSQPLGIEPMAAACAGTAVSFSSFGALAGGTYTWSFGDAAGPANTAVGTAVQHTYQQPGTYTVTLTGPAGPGGVAQVVQQQVLVLAAPALSLGSRMRTICAGEQLVLQANAQAAGTTYRWQDGSTAPTYVAHVAGRYALTVRSAGGCEARDSVQLTVTPLPTVRLLPPATLCPGGLPVLLRANAQPAGTTYRWPDGSTAETFAATRPGRYRLLVRSATGCTATDSVTVSGPQYDGECTPIFVPNIITADGDRHNDCFEIQGLLLVNWTLEVYNRWGRRIYQQAGYDNSWDAPGQPAGIYYYLLRNPGTGQQLRGWVEVVK